MGRWAESEFGVATLPHRAYVFAGPSNREKIDAILGSFGKALVHRHDIYERYLVGDAGGDAAFIFQLYGAPILCDLVTVLKDGQVGEAIFFGTAYGIAEETRVGDLVLPTKVQTLDGVTAKLGAGPYVSPDAGMVESMATALAGRSIPFRRGKSVSVPATFWHGDETQIDPDALALELEFAAFCHCARTVGLKAGGLLVISDTRDHGLLDKRIPCDRKMVEAFRAVKEHGGRSR
jgi:hypothetical protein